MPNGPINKLPVGLLDFFGIKNEGSYPRWLGDTLQPVLELGDWYANTNEIYFPGLVTQNLAPGATPPGQIQITVNPDPSRVTVTAGFLVVPQTEVWLINRMELNIAFPAEANDFASGYCTPGRVGWPQSKSGFNTSIATGIRIERTFLTRPAFAPPGGLVGFAHDGAVCTTAITTNGAIAFVPFRI